MILDKSAQRCSIFGYQILVISAGYNEKNEEKTEGKKRIKISRNGNCEQSSRSFAKILGEQSTG